MAKGVNCPSCTYWVACASCELYVCPQCGSDLPRESEDAVPRCNINIDSIVEADDTWLEEDEDG